MCAISCSQLVQKKLSRRVEILSDKGSCATDAPPLPPGFHNFHRLCKKARNDDDRRRRHRRDLDLDGSLSLRGVAARNQKNSHRRGDSPLRRGQSPLKNRVATCPVAPRRDATQLSTNTHADVSKRNATIDERKNKLLRPDPTMTNRRRKSSWGLRVVASIKRNSWSFDWPNEANLIMTFLSHGLNEPSTRNCPIVREDDVLRQQ
jgi:hypothetical protein